MVVFDFCKACRLRTRSVWSADISKTAHAFQQENDSDADHSFLEVRAATQGVGFCRRHRKECDIRKGPKIDLLIQKIFSARTNKIEQQNAEALFFSISNLNLSPTNAFQIQTFFLAGFLNAFSLAGCFNVFSEKGKKIVLGVSPVAKRFLNLEHLDFVEMFTQIRT